MNDRSEATVITVGKRQFVFGLRWFCPDEEGGVGPVIRKHLEEASERAGAFDICVIRKGSYEQFALGAKAHGLKTGLVSAAALFADFAGSAGSWLVAAEIDGVFWVSFGRDGCVLPGGDVVFTDSAKAWAHFTAAQTSMASINYLYAPEEWHVMGSAVMPVESMFSGRMKGSSRLVAISRFGDLAKVAMLAVVIGVAGVGGYTLFSDFFTPAPVVIQEYIEENPDDGLVDFVEPTPWVGLPAASATISACKSAILAMPRGILRTPVLSVACVNETVSAEYIVEDDFPHWISDWATRDGGFNATISNDMSSVNVSAPVVLPPAPVQVEALPENRAPLIAAMRRIASIEGQQAQFDPFAPGEIPIDARDPVARYASATFKILTLDPERHAAALSGVSGVEITNVSLGRDLKTFEINGVLHAYNR